MPGASQDFRTCTFGVRQGFDSHAKEISGRAGLPAGSLHVRRDPKTWLARTTLAVGLLVAVGMVVVQFPCLRVGFWSRDWSWPDQDARGQTEWGRPF